ncbi:Protein of unknown function [Pyronema omphalodes CBS 100304]|uniref:Uncharacterized protein n=1 Tax=Pyronema omphalodes (strain CBS 100304) TaxID=1076935 RepID=U4LIC8_PYROM|nr:Protein of unknown function [Pyronema omphalodes CBS 100304]
MSQDLNPLFDKRQIIDNCKYLFGKDVDPMVVTDSFFHTNSQWYWRAFVIDRNRSYSIPLPAQSLSGITYSILATDNGYLAVTYNAGCFSSPVINMYHGNRYPSNYNAIYQFMYSQRN